MAKKYPTKGSYESLKALETQDDLFEKSELACEQMVYESNSTEHFATIKHRVDTHRKNLKCQIDSSVSDMIKKTHDSKEFFAQKLKETQQIPDLDENKNVTIEEGIQLLRSKINDVRLISSQVKKCTFEAENEVPQSSFGILSSLYLNRYLVSSSSDNSIKTWDLVNKRCVQTFVGLTCHLKYLDELSNGLLIGVFNEKVIKVWNKEGKCVKTLRGHENAITCLKVFPDKNRVATGSYKQIKVWDIQLDKCVNTFIYYIDGWVKCIHALPKDSLAHCSGGNTIRFWNMALDPIKYNNLFGHRLPVNCLLLLKDDRLASGSDDKSIKIWIVASCVCIQTLLGHTDSVLSFVSTEKCELISSSRDKTIKIWNLTNGQCLNTLYEDSTWIGSLLNEFLVSAAGDNSVKVWNLENGMPMHSFWTLQIGVNSMVLMQ